MSGTSQDGALPMLLVCGTPRPLRDAWSEALGARAIEITSLHAALAGDAGVRCVAFYQSPWEAFVADRGTGPVAGVGQADSDFLAGWALYASALVAAASRWPSRIVLVNAGRLASRQQALVDMLAADGWCPPVEAPAIAAPMPAADTRLLARLFDHYAPEGWDTYEELEAMALLLGREAEFRAGDADLDDPLAEALKVWGEAVAARRDAGSRVHRDELEAAMEQARRLEQACADSEERRGHAETALRALEVQVEAERREAQDVSNENELLLEHVAQLRQELAEQERSVQQMRETVVRLSHAADQARRLISR